MAAGLTSQISELDRYEPSGDDQLGISALLKAELPEHIPVLPAYDRTTDIVNSLTGAASAELAQDDLLTEQSVLFISNGQ